MKRDLRYEIRPYRQADEAGVLDLLSSSLGGGPAGERTPAFFRWKHLDNPFGSSVMLVAESDERIIGLRSFMRWRWRADEREISAVRAVDTATHPDAQGAGVFSRLTRETLELLRGNVDLVFNTPNEKSLPGYLKMGWTVVGRVPIRVRVKRPVRFAAARLRAPAPSERPETSAPAASEALADLEEVSLFLKSAEAGGARLHTDRDAAFLAWRYGTAPHLDYRCIAERTGGRLTGLAFFRIRQRGAAWETTVADLIVARDEVSTASRLLRRVVRAAGVDQLTCHFPSGSAAARAATRNGFLRAPGGMTFVANPLREAIHPDPTALASWALCVGDLEVF